MVNSLTKKGHQMKNKKTQSEELRERAEELLRAKPSKGLQKLSDEDMAKVMYELEIHQLELELQNEELRLAQTAASNYAAKYFDLYDRAPIGYMTLSKVGLIGEINHLGSQIFQKEGSKIKGIQLVQYIAVESKPIFNHFLWRTFTENTIQTCEVTLKIDNKTTLDVSLTGVISHDEESCFLTIIDITKQKKAEDELKKWATLFQPKAN